MHKAGFINIIGRPNVGKSTLMNALVGERLSIITPKAQTTRHRIIGIVNGDDYQVIFSDTPGFIRDPKYKLQESMNQFIQVALDDADLLIFLTEFGEKFEEDDLLIRDLRKQKTPLLVLVNKIDMASPEKLDEKVAETVKLFPDAEVLPISALEKFNIDILFKKVLEHMPEHPPYYDKDALTDRPERFFVTEIIREKILLQYKQEIPYSCEVEIDAYQEDEDIDRIRAIIYINRKTQKAIIIGKQGAAIKQLGIAARKDIEEFLKKRVYLELHVKIKEKWRDSDYDLKRFGYKPY